MRRGELKIQWRGEVNPLFVLGIQYGRFIVRIAEELRDEAGDIEQRAPMILAQMCKETLRLLPRVPCEDLDTRQQVIKELGDIGKEDELLGAPEVREPLAEVTSRVRAAPKALLMKGLTEPHWWMARDTRSEGVQERLTQSLLNALALLHFKTPLHALKEQVVGSDVRLFGHLFHIDTKVLEARHVPLAIERIMKYVRVRDEATRIVGKALLLRKDPPGHQLPLRMALFFGWDFGLKDLSNDELYTFLIDMHIVPPNYDPETLRKYRNRMVRELRMRLQ